MLDSNQGLHNEVRLVEAMYADREVLARYDAGDKARSDQTFHDRRHAFQVRDVGMALTDEIDARLPGALDERTKKVIIPAALFLHDNGSAEGEKNHNITGARWARDYMTRKGFSRDTVREVCRCIALHRSRQALAAGAFRRPDFGDAAWAIVVIADKAVGDETRVRPAPLKELQKLRKQRKVHLWKGSIHDRINYAIKGSELIVDGRGEGSSDPGVIVLRLRIDPLVCQPADIYDLYRDRFHACGRAAQYLGFLFRLEFNGVRYMYSKETEDWVPVSAIKVSGRAH